jgi:hypothetical protein
LIGGRFQAFLAGEARLYWGLSFGRLFLKIWPEKVPIVGPKIAPCYLATSRLFYCKTVLRRDWALAGLPLMDLLRAPATDSGNCGNPSDDFECLFNWAHKAAIYSIAEIYVKHCRCLFAGFKSCNA